MIRARVRDADDGVLRDEVAMGDLRGLGEAGRAGEEEEECCCGVFGLATRGEARPGAVPWVRRIR
jgi:hypothetical protein